MGRVVVTGGAGFIGANLVRRLASARARDRIVVLDDLSTGIREHLDGLDIEVAVGSILDRDLVGEVTAGAASIVHLAAVPSVPRSMRDPVRSHDVNATGTLSVLEAARTAGAHVIVASSSSVYGDTDVLPKHEGLVPRPRSPYAASKLSAESYALAYAAGFGLEVLAFRFFNVYGPLQAAGHAYAAAVPTFIAAALAGEPLTVHGDGQQTRDFTFVDSVTAVIADAIERRVTADGAVNLAFGSRTSILELTDALERALGMSIERRHVEPRAGDVRDSQADQTRLRALFPEIEPVALAEGLARTVAWFRESSPSPQSSS